MDKNQDLGSGLNIPDLGSGLNIPDLQHCFPNFFEKKIGLMFKSSVMYFKNVIRDFACITLDAKI
jgi:hypothetical protein